MLRRPRAGTRRRTTYYSGEARMGPPGPRWERGGAPQRLVTRPGKGGGEGGIRTLDGLPHTAFPVRRPRPLGDLSGRQDQPGAPAGESGWRRGWDSNPRCFRTPLFESGTINHSDTSPRQRIPKAVRVPGMTRRGDPGSHPARASPWAARPRPVPRGCTATRPGAGARDAQCALTPMRRPASPRGRVRVATPPHPPRGSRTRHARGCRARPGR